MVDAKTAGLTPRQVEVFARGLFWLANVDGIEDSELAVISDFLAEAASDWKIDRLQALDPEFDPRELPAVLDTSFLRRVFLKAAVALIAADRKVSEREKRALHRASRLLGLSDVAYAQLEEEASRLSIEERTARKPAPVKSATK